jgi:hypothetical protein
MRKSNDEYRLKLLNENSNERDVVDQSNVEL